MPLDAQINELFNLEGTKLDFKVKYEDTKFAGKRYVRNSVTGDYLGIVGDKFKCIKECLYLYNKHNPLSDDKVSLDRQVSCENKIRNAKKYQALETL